MDLKREFSKFNIEFFGVCDASLYNRVMGTDYKVCIVALFPYFCGYPEKSNISIYSHGRDYHLVTADILSSVARGLKLKNFKIHSDTGPEIERSLAVSAGLCFIGKNGMCINDKYGSYFFIGYIACDASLELAEPLNKDCMGCMKCISACPGGAIGDSFDIERCLSHITQKKGELTESEQDIIRNNGTAFGCDICQRVCPHNRYADSTPISDFYSDVVTCLSLEEISQMTNRSFKERYGNRSFAWRGRSVIERNLRILSEKPSGD